MADSDSEAFESADEDVEEKKSKTVKAEIPKDKPAPPEVLPVDPVKEENPPQQKAETPSSWRSWGAFSVISNASKHVASITTQVSQSISTAIDSMNIPEPEEMAKMHVEQKKVDTQEDSSGGGDKSSEKSEDSIFKLDNLLSGVTQISSKVVSGGLDTLEGIGKKTINMIQETDPNIKSKLRGMKVTSQPNLSDLLKEAKDRVDEPSPTANEKSLSSVSFEHLLDEYKGFVFLEALEILSNQSKMKIELLTKPLSGKALSEMEETLAEVSELCELDTDNLDESLTAGNLETKLKSATEDLSVKLNFSEIVSYSNESEDWLDGVVSGLDLGVIYEKSNQVIAKLCALSLNNLQKLAELLLSQDHRSTADEADSLTQLVLIYCSLLNYFAVKFTEKMTATDDKDGKKMATNVFLESANAVFHIKKAFNLFLPVLQIGAV